MKKIFIVLFAILLSLVIVVIILIYKKNQGSEANIVISLSELSKLKPLNGEFKSMNSNKLVVLFSPSCDLCLEEFQLLEKNHEKISDIQLILISPYDKIHVSDFIKKFNFCNSDNTTILTGDHTTLNKIFGSYSFPTMFVLDKNGKLNRKFTGEVSFESLFRPLKKN